ncbi:MAG: hypothetical protein HZB24_10850 [Desulfobacterales bacterium]|nr:hypothetical protein [Desulfobacterales bacterium]
MGFSMEDVIEIIQIVKECKDTELHIDTGDLSLSLYKGKVGSGARSPLSFSDPGCGFAKPAAVAAPAAPAAKAPPVAEVTTAAQSEPAAPWGSGSLPAATLDGDFDESTLHAIKASVPSVFYRRPSPEEAPFVEVGDEVEPETVLCLLEVMKCYRQVMAGVKGRIVKICVQSNMLVEEGQTLFLIEPK